MLLALGLPSLQWSPSRSDGITFEDGAHPSALLLPQWSPSRSDGITLPDRLVHPLIRDAAMDPVAERRDHSAWRPLGWFAR